MKERISNHTSIGNTNNPLLKVTKVVAAYDIKERTNFMHDELKYSSKKELTRTSTVQKVKTVSSPEYSL